MSPQRRRRIGSRRLHFAATVLGWDPYYGCNAPVAVIGTHSFEDPLASNLLWNTAPKMPEIGQMVAVWLGQDAGEFPTPLSRRRDSDDYHPSFTVPADDALRIVRWVRESGMRSNSRGLKRVWNSVSPDVPFNLEQLIACIEPELKSMRAFLRSHAPTTPIVAWYAAKLEPIPVYPA
jgi:hypothetical protein